MKRNFIVVMLVLVAAALFATAIEESAESTEGPQYGGSLTLYWWGQEVPSADVVDNNWVTRMYFSGVVERLAMPNFEEFGVRGNGEFTNFNTDNIPEKYARGALAESWEISETRMVFNIRRGVMWAADGIFQAISISVSAMVARFWGQKDLSTADIKCLHG